MCDDYRWVTPPIRPLPRSAMTRLGPPVAAVCSSAIDDLVARSSAESRRLEDLVARTPGGVPAHERVAVPIRFEVERDR